jgi:hypothetical protein
MRSTPDRIDTGCGPLDDLWSRYAAAILERPGILIPDTEEDLNWHAFLGHSLDMQGFRAAEFVGVDPSPAGTAIRPATGTGDRCERAGRPVDHRSDPGSPPHRGTGDTAQHKPRRAPCPRRGSRHLTGGGVSTRSRGGSSTGRCGRCSRTRRCWPTTTTPSASGCSMNAARWA